MDEWLGRDEILLTSMLAADGWSSSQIRRSVNTGELTQLRRGAYRLAQGPVDAVAAHRYRALAAARLNSRVAISHVSAVVLHGLPLWQADLATVHLMRLGPGRAERTSELALHLRPPGVSPVNLGRVQVMGVADSLVQFGMMLPARSDPLTWRIAGDAAMHLRQTTMDDLRRSLELHAGRTGIARVRGLVDLLDERHESPGETRLAAALERLGIVSTPQVEFETCGRAYRVDRLLADAPVAVEFDGAVKLGTSIDLGRRALLDEKRREDDLRSIGLEFVRIDWARVGDLPWLERQIGAARLRARRGVA